MLDLKLEILTRVISDKNHGGLEQFCSEGREVGQTKKKSQQLFSFSIMYTSSDNLFYATIATRHECC